MKEVWGMFASTFLCPFFKFSRNKIQFLMGVKVILQDFIFIMTYMSNITKRYIPHKESCV